MVVLIVAAGSFYGGMSYQKSQVQQVAVGGQLGNGAMVGSGGQGTGFRGAFGSGQGRPVAGQITAKDDKSITLKLRDGSTKVVSLSVNTAISKSASGTVEDLKQGEQIMAFGEENSDGSVAATTIQLGGFRGFGGFGGNGGNGRNNN